MTRFSRVLTALTLLALSGGITRALGQSCPCTIWNASVAPSVIDSGDGSAGEYGVKFRTNTNGQITGVRFYKSVANNGTHIGHLWSSDGTLLASATFTGETTSGWQQVTFSAPVSIAAGTTYIASYFTATGHYSYNSGYFAANGVDNGPLHVLAEGEDGSNGVYAYSTTSTFPVLSYQSSNYWVDVVFQASAPQEPAVVSVSPANGLAGVSLSSAVSATFNESIDPTTVNGNTVQLLDASNNVVSATVTYVPGTLTATLRPSNSLLASSNYTAVVKGGSTDPRVKSAVGNPLPANSTWSFTTANPPGSCPCTIWDSSATPSAIDSGDPNSGEFGVRLRSDENGFITGIRFYKSSSNTGVHVGNIWTNDGTLLGSVTFNGESSSGWQQANFATPISVTAGTTYVASYFTSMGHYSYNPGFFTSAVDHAPLHALRDGADGSDGVFAYSANSVFPATTFGSGNYWVDILFNTTAPSEPPTVTTYSPANGSGNVSVSAPVTVTFNKAIDPSTLNSGTFLLLDHSNNAVAAVMSYNPATLTGVLQPSAPLASASSYTAIVRGGTMDPRVKDSSGTPMAANVSWSFVTASTGQPPTVTSFSPASGSSGVSTTTAVTATFSKAIDTATLNSSTFQLLDPSNQALAASLTYDSATLTAKLQPSSPLQYQATYTVVVQGGSSGLRIKDLSGNGLSQSVTWTFTTADPPAILGTCPCSIFGSNVPANPDSQDAAGVELGVKFRADINGFIKGLRFYKSAANTGTHVGSLWASNGTLLASATFSNETASGWQEVTFASPVSITAGTTYVAAYFAPNGHYAYDENAFASAGIDNEPLHALANGVSGGDGVYVYGSTPAFPTLSYNASNYWVDVLYLYGTSTTPPAIASVTPANGTTGVTLASTVNAVFSEPMDASTINGSTFSLVDSSNKPVTGSVAFDYASSTASYVVPTGLMPLQKYTATISGSVKDAFGNAMGQTFTWSFTTGSAPANSGPGGPILVISSTTNPFTRYYGEILQTEGLNEFTVQDMSTVTSATLSSYDIVILGDMALSSSQVSMLTSWVSTGGRLIAMHPDKQLASLLGLTSTSGTLSNAYLLVNTTKAPGAGIVGQTIQFHGSADLYSLNGAVAFATLYSNTSTATSFPAGTWANFGTGQAAAFTYDLARSVVYTRQGNPAWSGEDRDQTIDPSQGNSQIRSDDLFFGNASFDPEPDWVNLDKVAIPQADEQQRLLANLIQLMNFNKKPLPHFWYFPSGFKAVVIMSGDDHNYGGTSARFDQYLDDSPANCSVADWTCVRSTSYVFPDTPIPNYQTYVAQGFEIANHTDNIPTCTTWTPASLDAAITTQLAAAAQNFPNLPAPKTSRTHCVLWSDYDSEPKILLKHGIRFDTSYYYWPDTWILDRPGMFTGSGMPMRYADRQGNIVDVYQATTQMPDESNETMPDFINALLDNAQGSQGYYGVFTANMHTDFAESAGSDAIIASAQQHGVPIVSSLQMLTWLDGRNSSSFGSLAWNGSTLSFTVTVGTGARNLQALLPVNSSAGSLRSISLGGKTVSFTTQAIKGIQYAFFSAAAGSYQAKYGAGGAFSLSGNISGNGGSGAAVALTGTGTANVTADPSGNYLITGLTSGSYTVKPSASGYTITPSSRNITISGANVTGVNFASTLIPTFSISGTISGAGGSAATVKLTGSSSLTTVSSSSGNFTFSGVVNGTYTITPAKSGYTFSPTSRNVTVNNVNVTGVTFSSTAATSTTIAVDTTISMDLPSTSSSISTPVFSTALGNELLLAFVAADNQGTGTNLSVSNVTGAGLTWVLVGRTNTQFGTSEIWRTLAPAPLTNAFVTATYSIPSPQSSITVVAFSGVDFSGTSGSGAIGAVASGNANPGAPTASLVTTRTNSWVFGVGNDWDGPVARVPGSNQSLVHQYLAPSATLWVQMNNSPVASKGTRVTVNDSSPTDDRYNLTIVEIRRIGP